MHKTLVRPAYPLLLQENAVSTKGFLFFVFLWGGGDEGGGWEVGGLFQTACVRVDEAQRAI